MKNIPTAGKIIGRSGRYNAARSSALHPLPVLLRAPSAMGAICVLKGRNPQLTCLCSCHL